MEQKLVDVRMQHGSMECDSNHYRRSKAPIVWFRVAGAMLCSKCTARVHAKPFSPWLRPLRAGRRDHLLLIPILGKVGGSFLCVPLLLLDACYRIPSCGL